MQCKQDKFFIGYGAGATYISDGYEEHFADLINSAAESALLVSPKF